MPVPPPLELKLAVKRSQYKHARSERKKELIALQAKRLKRESKHDEK